MVFSFAAPAFASRGTAFARSTERYMLAFDSDPRQESRVGLLAQENDEVPAQEVGLVLDRGAAARRHQHVEQLAVARLLARGGVLVQRVQDLVDDARDLALRDHQIAAAERAAPVRRVGAEDVQDALGDAAIAPHAGYRRQ